MIRSSILWLCLISPVASQGHHQRGLELYRVGDYAGAAEAFREAVGVDADNAEYAFNLALALWRAGQAEEAERVAAKAATLSDGRLGPLRDGLLGNLRFEAAQAKASTPATAGPDGQPGAPDLQGALKLAKASRDYFLAGASAHPKPELLRNLERSLALIKQIEEQLEQQKQDDQKQDDEQQNQDEQQQDEQQQDQQKQDEQKQDQQKQDEQKQDEQKQDEQKQDQQQQDQQKQDQQQPEQDDAKPKPDDQPQQPEPDEQQQQQQEQQQPDPSQQPQQSQPPPELSDEEKQRLLEALRQLLEQQAEMRERAKAKRPKVKKDW